MKKTIPALAFLVAASVGACGTLFLQSSAALADAADSNIDIGAVPTTDICRETAGHAHLVCLADALKATLSPDLLARVQLSYTVADAQRWSNLPPSVYTNRVGATLGDFTTEQRSIIKALLIEATSLTPNEGFDELEQILNADDYLKANTTDNAGFSSSNYYIALLGTPAATGTWQLYFGGHHLALSNTYKDGVLVGATPSFRGVEPFAPFAQNGRNNAPMAQEQADFAAPLNSLTADQAARAKLAETYTNIIAGAQKDDAIPTANEGLRVGDLYADQQALVLAAIETYVRDITLMDADVIMARYTAELSETYIAFSGTPNLDAEDDYVRIDGPSVWIEISMQPGRSLPGIHPHSVWRDKVSDYGTNK